MKRTLLSIGNSLYWRKAAAYNQDRISPFKRYLMRAKAQGGVSMFRLWGKIFKDNHLLKDTVIKDPSEDTRTHKIFRAIDEICRQFDLGKPIWLETNIKDFKRHNKVRFRQDNFMEAIDFDYLEIQVIEEDS